MNWINLHDGFVDKNSFDYKLAKDSATTDLKAGCMLLAICLIYGALILASDVGRWPIALLQASIFAPVSAAFIFRYLKNKRTNYGF